MVTMLGPSEIFTVMAAPDFSFAPATGLCDMISLATTVADGPGGFSFRVKPSLSRRAVACVRVLPTSEGTAFLEAKRPSFHTAPPATATTTINTAATRKPRRRCGGRRFGGSVP